MNQEWVKFTTGVMGFITVAVLISYVLSGPARAELDADARNPGNDKITELGTTMKMWATGFGADVEKNAVASKQVFLDDMNKIKNSEFVQYQKAGWAQGQADWAKTQADIKTLPDRLIQIPGDIVTGLSNFAKSIMGGNSENNQK